METLLIKDTLINTNANYKDIDFSDNINYLKEKYNLIIINFDSLYFNKKDLDLKNNKKDNTNYLKHEKDLKNIISYLHIKRAILDVNDEFLLLKDNENYLLNEKLNKLNIDVYSLNKFIEENKKVYNE